MDTVDSVGAKILLTLDEMQALVNAINTNQNIFIKLNDPQNYLTGLYVTQPGRSGINLIPTWYDDIERHVIIVTTQDDPDPDPVA